MSCPGSNRQDLGHCLAHSRHSTTNHREWWLAAIMIRSSPSFSNLSLYPPPAPAAPPFTSQSSVLLECQLQVSAITQEPQSWERTPCFHSGGLGVRAAPKHRRSLQCGDRRTGQGDGPCKSLVRSKRARTPEARHEWALSAGFGAQAQGP